MITFTRDLVSWTELHWLRSDDPDRNDLVDAACDQLPMWHAGCDMDFSALDICIDLLNAEEARLEAAFVSAQKTVERLCAQ